MNKTISLAILASVVLVLSFAFNLSPIENQVNAQETTPFPSREKVISVTGIASTSVDPDLLVIQFGVETQEKTAKASLESNSQMMSNVVNAIKGVGITEDELSTSRLNISPVYDYYNDPLTKRNTQELIGYRVSNILMVETKQLDKAADIIDGAVQVGANRIDSVYFTLSPQKQLEIKDGLLEGAVLNAKSKAEKALSPLNHKIIGVKAVSLSEFGMPPPIPYPPYGFDMAEGVAMKATTQVFSSEQDVTTTASVIFLIGSN
jgi:uncharacterized protein